MTDRDRSILGGLLRASLLALLVAAALSLPARAQMYAPAATPTDVVERLSTAIAAAVRTPAIKDRLLSFGLVPTGTSSAELAKIQQADSELWAPAVKASGFTPEQ